MRIVQQVIILSAELASRTFDENMAMSKVLESCLKDDGFTYSQAIGVYKGKSEISFVVPVNTQEQIDTLTDLAFNVFEQESVLYQDANQHAHLLFSDGQSQKLGLLKQVDKNKTDNLDAYTILGGKYYATA